MKKVVIIGGGISGLTAGIYLQFAGFETIILEKNRVPGGECMGWKREGFTIDNCIRWLTDSKDGSHMNQLWKNIGMLGGDVKLYERDAFFSFSMNGKTVTFWRDLERTRQELLELAPEDTENIEKLITNVRKAECRHVPIQKPMDKMGIKDFMKMAASMKEVPAVEKAYKGMSITDLAASFKNPIISKALRQMVFEDNRASSFIFSYAAITGGNGDIPLGGSLAASLRIADRYRLLGGELRLGTPVRNVVINKNRATGVVLEGGYQIEADYVICATDVNHIFTRLLPNKYMPKSLKERFKDTDNYSIYSGFHVAFSIDEKGIVPSGTNFFDCQEFSIARSKVDTFRVTCFDYDPSLSPEGKSVIQVQIQQRSDDCEYWVRLRATDSLAYEKRKMEYAKLLQNIVEKEFPQLVGKIRMLDAWTPATYVRFCNAYKGAYMAFASGKNAKSGNIPGVVKGLENVFLAGQWVIGSGGLPLASAAGRFAAWRIEKKES